MIGQSKTIKEFLQRVLPLYDSTFNDKSLISQCELVPSTNDFIVKFPTPNNAVFSSGKLSFARNGRTDLLGINDNITLTNLLFKYNYDTYTIEPTIGNRFYLHLHKNSLDVEIDKDMAIYLKLANIIKEGYYRVYSVKRSQNSTTVTILMFDGYFDLKTNTDPIEVYTDYGNTLSGYNGVKKIKNITENSGVVSITLEKDAHFNFNINAIDFFCGFAEMHYNFDFLDVIPEEFRKHKKAQYGASKRNAIVVSVPRSRPDDGGIDLSSIRSTPRILTSNIHLFFYREIFLDKSSGERVEDPTISDGMQDKALAVADNIMKISSIYTNYTNMQPGLSIEGDVTRVDTGRFDPMSDGTVEDNMCEYRIVLDIHKDLLSMENSLLNKESMIRAVQSQINLQKYGS